MDTFSSSPMEEVNTRISQLIQRQPQLAHYLNRVHIVPNGNFFLIYGEVANRKLKRLILRLAEKCKHHNEISVDIQVVGQELDFIEGGWDPSSQSTHAIGQTRL